MQFLLFPQCFQKACFPEVSKGVIVWEWVNDLYDLLANFINVNTNDCPRQVHYKSDSPNNTRGSTLVNLIIFTLYLICQLNLGSSNSAVNKDMITKICTHRDTITRLRRKHCMKRRNCLLRAISSFPTMFSKAV